jgi:hypothetical protein
MGETNRRWRQSLATGQPYVCCGCKSGRNDEGYWQQVEIYLAEHRDAKVSHGLCPVCLDRLYPSPVE